MSTAQIAILGAVAGFTIFLGLPLGRMRNPAPGLRAVLNAGAVGVLLFLLWDVLAHAWEPVDSALGGHRIGTALGDGLVLAVGLAVGLLGLVYVDRWIAGRAAPSGQTEDMSAPARAQRLAMLIALGIGLHNFAEGLAIGSSAAHGEIALAVLLIVGFGLHNATEGFGIVAPLAAAGVRPTWGRLALLGLIGGGPTLVGTLVGQRFTSDLVSIAFLALAAGSILYVVIELLAVGRRMAAKHVVTWGLFAGLMLGFVTDAVVTAGGA